MSGSETPEQDYPPQSVPRRGHSRLPRRAGLPLLREEASCATLLKMAVQAAENDGIVSIRRPDCEAWMTVRVPFLAALRTSTGRLVLNAPGSAHVGNTERRAHRVEDVNRLLFHLGPGRKSNMMPGELKRRCTLLRAAVTRLLGCICTFTRLTDNTGAGWPPPPYCGNRARAACVQILINRPSASRSSPGWFSSDPTRPDLLTVSFCLLSRTWRLII